MGIVRYVRLALWVAGVYEAEMAQIEEALRLEAEREGADEAKLARSRWLEEQGSERAFVCGFIPTARELETGERPLNVLPEERRVMLVTAAVLPHDVAFFRVDGDGVEELERIPRNAIRDVDVVDRSGNHVPEPIHETFEPPAISLMRLRWTNAGADDEELFAF